MIIGSNMQTLIVGFLVNYDKAKDFELNSWVEVTGTISKGDYHGSIPVINVEEIKKVDKPKDVYVRPPDDTYVPTSIVF